MSGMFSTVFQRTGTHWPATNFLSAHSAFALAISCAVTVYIAVTKYFNFYQSRSFELVPALS